MTVLFSVLVEGPDRVGKTTLVSHLSHMLDLPTFKSPNEREVFKHGGRQSLVFDYGLTHFLTQTNHHFIADRSYVSEWVYSRVFKRDTDHELLERIDLAHSLLGTRVLYIVSSVEPVEKDDLVPDGMYDQVVQGYREFLEWTSCRVYGIDTSLMLEEFTRGGDISPQVAQRCFEMLTDVPERERKHYEP